MKTATIDVTWTDDRGGRLVARCEDNPTLASNVIEWPEPITASSDSHEIASAVCALTGVGILSVDHDGDTVIVVVDDSRE